MVQRTRAGAGVSVGDQSGAAQGGGFGVRVGGVVSLAVFELFGATETQVFASGGLRFNTLDFTGLDLTSAGCSS